MKKCILWGNWVSKRSRKGLGETLTIKKTFTLSVNKIIICQFSMFKSLDSISSVVGIFMYLTISKFKHVPRSRKGLGKVSTTTLVTFLKSPFGSNCSYHFFVSIISLCVQLEGFLGKQDVILQN